jgi:chitin disaccharide deacetylase
MSSPPDRRILIVNADDFGLSPGVNHGIIKAHEQGVVTSASLMVRGPAATEAAEYARAHPALSVGLHVDLCEWMFSEDEWRPVYEVVRTDDPIAVAEEVARQLDTFHSLLGRDPTHLDSHQHVHRSEPIHTILAGHARRLGIVLRSYHPKVRYCGNFYGQSDKGDPYPEGISVEALLGLLRTLPEGVTELGCHPADPGDVESIYCRERVVECDTLCDPRIRATLRAERIVLRSFSDLAGLTGP